MPIWCFASETILKTVKPIIRQLKPQKVHPSLFPFSGNLHLRRFRDFRFHFLEKEKGI
jgi:hypothetical protein